MSTPRILASLGPLFLLFTAVACEFRQETASPQPVEDFPVSDRVLGYNSLYEQVLSKSCLPCHNATNARAGVVVTDYASAASAAEAIDDAVRVSQSMPPKGPLSLESQRLIRQWVLAGAPENDQDAASLAAEESFITEPSASGESSAEPSEGTTNP